MSADLLASRSPWPPRSGSGMPPTRITSAAVGSLIAGDGADAGPARRLGAWWGMGHAAVLLAVGIPLIAFVASIRDGRNPPQSAPSGF